LKWKEEIRKLKKRERDRERLIRGTGSTIDIFIVWESFNHICQGLDEFINVRSLGGFHSQTSSHDLLDRLTNGCSAFQMISRGSGALWRMTACFGLPLGCA
jgi:hypothetical protein